MKTFVLIAVLFAECAGQTQNPDPRFFAVNLALDGSTPSSIRFLCSQNYDKTECLKDATELRKALAPYPLRLLGSYYLVAAQAWEPLARSRGGNKCSVAFTLLLGRATVFDSKLVSPSADRTMELQRYSAVTGTALLDLAVTHELGHAVCREKDERRAEQYAKDLRNGRAPDCSKTPGHKAVVMNPNQPLNILPAQGQSTVEVHAGQDGLPATVSKIETFGYHSRPEVMDAMRLMWLLAGDGTYGSEAGFSYDSDGTINFAPHSNQYSHESIPKTPSTVAVFHTHPNSRSARMSSEDIAAANQANVEMYVLSRAGLYHYKPGMKNPELLMSGTGFLTEKQK